MIGPSGAGKSALLAALAGGLRMYASCSGRVALNGIDERDEWPVRPTFDVAEDALETSLTVRELLTYTGTWVSQLRNYCLFCGMQKRRQE